MQEKSKESSQMLRQLKKTTFIRIKKGGRVRIRIIFPAHDFLFNSGLCLHRQSDAKGLKNHLDILVSLASPIPPTEFSS